MSAVNVGIVPGQITQRLCKAMASRFERGYLMPLRFPQTDRHRKAELERHVESRNSKRPPHRKSYV